MERGLPHRHDDGTEHTHENAPAGHTHEHTHSHRHPDGTVHEHEHTHDGSDREHTHEHAMR